MIDYKNRIGRRSLLRAGAVSLAGLPVFASAASQKKNSDMIDPDAGVTAPEDLMKEHGVLNRCLLIYEEREQWELGSSQDGIRPIDRTGKISAGHPLPGV